MIARVDFHVVKQGMLEGAKKQVVDNTRVARSTGQVRARYMLCSRKDPSMLVTVSMWNKRSAPDLYIVRVREDIKKRGEPNPWQSIEGDEFEVTALVENGADGPIAVARLEDHILVKGLEDVATAKIIINTQIAMSTGGVIHRYSLPSCSNPQRVITLTFWSNAKALEEFREKAVAASKLIGGDSPWASIVGEDYDTERLV